MARVHLHCASAASTLPPDALLPYFYCLPCRTPATAYNTRASAHTLPPLPAAARYHVRHLRYTTCASFCAHTPTPAPLPTRNIVVTWLPLLVASAAQPAVYSSPPYTHISLLRFSSPGWFTAHACLRCLSVFFFFFFFFTLWLPYVLVGSTCLRFYTHLPLRIHCFCALPAYLTVLSSWVLPLRYTTTLTLITTVQFYTPALLRSLHAHTTAPRGTVHRHCVLVRCISFGCCACLLTPPTPVPTFCAAWHAAAPGRAHTCARAGCARTLQNAAPVHYALPAVLLTVLTLLRGCAHTYARAGSHHLPLRVLLLLYRLPHKHSSVWFRYRSAFPLPVHTRCHTAAARTLWRLRRVRLPLRGGNTFAHTRSALFSPRLPRRLPPHHTTYRAAHHCGCNAHAVQFGWTTGYTPAALLRAAPLLCLFARRAHCRHRSRAAASSPDPTPLATYCYALPRLFFARFGSRAFCCLPRATPTPFTALRFSPAACRAYHPTTAPPALLQFTAPAGILQHSRCRQPVHGSRSGLVLAATLYCVLPPLRAHTVPPFSAHALPHPTALRCNSLHPAHLTCRTPHTTRTVATAAPLVYTCPSRFVGFRGSVGSFRCGFTALPHARCTTTTSLPSPAATPHFSAAHYTAFRHAFCCLARTAALLPPRYCIFPTCYAHLPTRLFFSHLPTLYCTTHACYHHLQPLFSWLSTRVHSLSPYHLFSRAASPHRASTPARSFHAFRINAPRRSHAAHALRLFSRRTLRSP